MCGSDAFHADFNRLCVPYSSQFRRKETVIIMWTPTVINGRIHHFVPLLKKKILCTVRMLRSSQLYIVEVLFVIFSCS